MSIYDPRIVDALIAQATAHKDFLEEHGIETIGEGSIGFSEDEQKWYGWSHRSIVGFGIGDKLFDPEWVPPGESDETDDCGFIKAVEDIDFNERGAITIETLEQAKQAAKVFQKYVD